MNDLEFVGDYRHPHLSARQRALGHDGTSAGDFTFGDFIDIINPLQHIPGVSTLYREITGDEISPHARILGDTLFGGPTGFLSSIANVLYEEISGEDVGETVIALFGGGDDEGAEPQFADGPADGLPAPLETAASPADPRGAQLPEPSPGMLTGQDARNALFMDLRASRPHEAILPPTGRPAGDSEAGSLPLPPRAPRETAAAAAPEVNRQQPAATTGAAAHPLLFAQESAGGAVADRMMQALDKYRAMARQTTDDGRKDEENWQDERILWQADPAAAGS